MTIFKTLSTFAVFILFLLPLSAQTTISWTGDDGDNQWSNPYNWNPKEIPSADHKVYIPEDAKVEYSGNSAIRFLRIGTNARLDITSGSLNITPPQNTEYYNLINFGVVNNHAILTLDQAYFTGLYNAAVLNNYGELNIANAGRSGIINRHNSTNGASGTINFNDIDGRHISNDNGTFTNDGKIKIQNNGDGIFNSAAFVNNGDIASNTSNSAKIHCRYSSTFDNYGNIELSGSVNQSAPFKFIKIDLNQSSNFTNHETGNIQLENFEEAITIKNQSHFENKGSVDIADRNGNTFGIVVAHSSSFKQLEGALCEIEVTFTGLHTAIDGNASNAGTMNISSTSSSYTICINNLGEMINHEEGTLNLSDAQGGIMMQNSSSYFINDGGKISFNNIGDVDMSIFSTFHNFNCGLIQGDKRIHLRGIFDNYGTLEYLTDGINHWNNFGKFSNNGIISDPFNRFDGQFTNDKIRSTALINPIVGYLTEDVLEISNDQSVFINPAFSVDPVINTGDASFNQFYNEIYLFNSVIGHDFLYADVDLAGCQTRLVLRVENPQSSFTGKTPGDSEDEMQFRQSSDIELTQLEAYPNPSNGMLHLTLPKSAQHATVQVIDLNGRIIWQEQANEASTIAVNLENQIAPGMYIIKVLDGEKMIGKQRWVVQ